MSESMIQTDERLASSAHRLMILSPGLFQVTPRDPDVKFTAGVIGDLPENADENGEDRTNVILLEKGP